MIPIIRGAKQVILVGDQCQLGPVIKFKPAGSAGLNKSLFERLMEIGHKPILLQYQYRMHPFLSEFSSNFIYNGYLKNGVTSNERLNQYKIPWPVDDIPLSFFHSSGSEVKKGHSYYNDGEAQEVIGIVMKLKEVGIGKDDIGIIATYDEQKTYIRNCMNKADENGEFYFNQIEVDTVDGYQGREKDFIILSCTRSNNRGEIGYLTEDISWKRINVALTRARYGLLICGNADLLSNVKSSTFL